MGYQYGKIVNFHAMPTDSRRSPNACRDAGHAVLGEPACLEIDLVNTPKSSEGVVEHEFVY